MTTTAMIWDCQCQTLPPRSCSCSSSDNPHTELAPVCGDSDCGEPAGKQTNKQTDRQGLVVGDESILNQKSELSD